MTGKDLLCYIIDNNLLDEPVFNDGKFIGFLLVEEVAKRLDVGTASVRALVHLDKLEGINVNGKLYISITSIVKYERKQACITEKN